MSSSDLEIQQKLNELYKLFETYMAKILAGHTKAQRALGPLSARDQAVVDDYKVFVRLKHKYENSFYKDMFTHWSTTILAPEFIFDEPIDFSLNKREGFFINMPVIHEWGLRGLETKGYVVDLEKVLISIASIFHPDEAMATAFKARLRELSPQSQGPAGVRPNILQGDFFKNMMGNMLNGIKNAPGFKEQLPEDFDGNEFTNTVFQSPTINNMMKDIQSGNFSMDKIGSIFEDPAMLEVVSKLSEGDKKPKSFAELPPELQPPGEPADQPSSSSSPSPPSLKAEPNDASLLDKGKDKAPEERTMEID